MRNDTSFRSFYDVVLLKSKNHPSMSGPDVTKENSPAKKNWNWHRRASISCDRTRLLQANILWKYWLDDERYWPAVWPAKLWYVCNDDVIISVLTAQMEILQVLLEDGDYFCFDDITVIRSYGWRCYLFWRLAHQGSKLSDLFALEWTRFVASVVTS